MIEQANWIKPIKDFKKVCPIFFKSFDCKKEIKSATLNVSAIGVFSAYLNDKKLGKDILSPGWTSYTNRIQYLTYDITKMLSEENTISIEIGNGWYRSRLGWNNENRNHLYDSPPCIIVSLEIIYTDGDKSIIETDTSWKCKESKVRFTDIYDGETYDASFKSNDTFEVEIYNGDLGKLVPLQGEITKEQEHISAAKIFKTPKGEIVVDFMQEVTGYVELTLDAKKGQEVILSHGEVLDKEGNFYNANYRSAKAILKYICKEGKQTYSPKFTFYGFRYIRIDSFPGGIENAKLENFKAIVVHSDMKRTGYLSCSNPLLNKLFSNIVWGQKGNFLDIPTDCPQRDERLGWTGDAQVFVKTAALNYDVEKFFTKWLTDVALEQGVDGKIHHVIPNILKEHTSSAAWGDAAVICPYEIYLAYGDKTILKNQFDSMKKWINYITTHTKDKYLWTGGTHFGDWLGLDAPSGSYKGSSRDDFIATCYYAYSTSLVIKAGKVLNEDVSYFETLYENIKETFRKTYKEYLTQTECVLAVHFKLAPDLEKSASLLRDMIIKGGKKLQTGFVGTPYILHVLSDYGYEELAYDLLLRKQYPSWLYPVTKGATTIWEHWDGIMENGDFWSTDMNSYNHYAYGAVADWVYGVAAGIKPVFSNPGYEKISISPKPDKRLDWLKASLETRHGLVKSEWRQENNLWCFDIQTPVDTIINIFNKSYEVKKGSYTFYHEIS